MVYWALFCYIIIVGVVVGSNIMIIIIIIIIIIGVMVRNGYDECRLCLFFVDFYIRSRDFIDIACHSHRSLT